jgi:hypothetical protein
MLKILLFFASKCYIFIPKPPRMAYSPSERASISSIFLKTILGTFLPHLEPDPYFNRDRDPTAQNPCRSIP